MDVAELADARLLLQLGTHGSVADEQVVEVGALARAVGGFEDHLQALLDAHVAGVGDDEFALQSVALAEGLAVAALAQGVERGVGARRKEDDFGGIDSLLVLMRCRMPSVMVATSAARW